MTSMRPIDFIQRVKRNRPVRLIALIPLSQEFPISAPTSADFASPRTHSRRTPQSICDRFHRRGFVPLAIGEAGAGSTIEELAHDRDPPSRRMPPAATSAAERCAGPGATAIGILIGVIGEADPLPQVEAHPHWTRSRPVQITLSTGSGELADLRRPCSPAVRSI